VSTERSRGFRYSKLGNPELMFIEQMAFKTHKWRWFVVNNFVKQISLEPNNRKG
jgi:hypothetical protein